jgi:hypothetical protein
MRLSRWYVECEFKSVSGDKSVKDETYWSIYSYTFMLSQHFTFYKVYLIYPQSLELALLLSSAH